MPAIQEWPKTPEAVERAFDSERQERQRYISTAWKYYRGEHKKPLKVRPGDPDDNVILNLCRRLVASGVAMLVGQDIKFDLVEGGTDAAEQALDAFWLANRKQMFMIDVATTGAVTGQPAVQMALPPAPGAPPRVVVLQPELLSVAWAPNDIGRVVGYSLRWKAAGVDWRQDIIAPGMRDNASWLVETWRRPVMGRWVLDASMPWPYSWAPVLTWKNLPNPGLFYGLSDLENAELNDSVNFIASNIKRIIRLHAHPRTIGTGMRASEVQKTAVDAFWTIPNPDAKIFNLEMISDLSSSMRFLDFLRAAFFAEGAGVDLTSFKDKIGQITNFGLQVLFRDALDKLEQKRGSYGEALVEINRRALEMMGFGSNLRTTIHWPEALPQDKEAMAKLVSMELAAGITSKETAAGALGLDWTVEQERKQAEASGEETLGAALVKSFYAGAGSGVGGGGGK